MNEFSRDWRWLGFAPGRGLESGNGDVEMGRDDSEMTTGGEVDWRQRPKRSRHSMATMGKLGGTVCPFWNVSILSPGWLTGKPHCRSWLPFVTSQLSLPVGLAGAGEAPTGGSTDARYARRPAAPRLAGRTLQRHPPPRDPGALASPSAGLPHFSRELVSTSFAFPVLPLLPILMRWWCSCELFHL
jgi:hypothetical protein